MDRLDAPRLFTIDKISGVHLHDKWIRASFQHRADPDLPAKFYWDDFHYMVGLDERLYPDDGWNHLIAFRPELDPAFYLIARLVPNDLTNDPIACPVCNTQSTNVIRQTEVTSTHTFHLEGSSSAFELLASREPDLDDPGTSGTSWRWDCCNMELSYEDNFHPADRGYLEEMFERSGMID